MRLTFFRMAPFFSEFISSPLSVAKRINSAGNLFDGAIRHIDDLNTAYLSQYSIAVKHFRPNAFDVRWLSFEGVNFTIIIVKIDLTTA